MARSVLHPAALSERPPALSATPAGWVRWRRRLAIIVAVAAVYPWALTRSLSRASGVMGVGPSNAWNVAFHSYVHRPAVLLAVTAVGLWAAAGALWVARSRMLIAAALGSALALCFASAALSISSGPRQSSVPATLLGRIRLGESSAAVRATLGLAPYVGVATSVESGETLPCLVYAVSGSLNGRLTSLCFRDGELALR